MGRRDGLTRASAIIFVMPDEQPSTDTRDVRENYAASIPSTVPPITRVREQPGEPVQPSTDASWFAGDPRTLPLT